MKNVLTPLPKRVFISLGLTVTPSATGAVIKKKNFESGITASIISNKEMDVIMNIVKSLEEYGSLIKCISETIENEAKEQKHGVLGNVIRYIRQ